METADEAVEEAALWKHEFGRAAREVVELRNKLMRRDR